MQTSPRTELHHATTAGHHVDICIVGAGIIGLTLALELHHRGLSVCLLEQGQPMREASWAAAGMLAALDPANPQELQPLARLSLQLYPEFLARIAGITGQQVRLRTTTTLLAADNFETSVHPVSSSMGDFLSAETVRRIAPAVAPGQYYWQLLEEPSLDPRDLCSALPEALQMLGIEMRAHTRWLSTSMAQPDQEHTSRRLQIHTTGAPVFTDKIVHCTGAWAAASLPAASLPAGSLPHSEAFSGIRPRKGQMLCLRLPAGVELTTVVHGPGCYIVPRGDGRVIIGSTIEDCGFDKSLDAAAIGDLRARAENLVPALRHAEEVERWAGLRPGSPDALPILGSIPGSPGSYIAAGHFRMGILLAPATARVMAQLLLDEPPQIDLQPFSPDRLIGHPQGRLA